MPAVRRVRLDDLLVRRGIAPSRHQAQILIRLGRIHAGDRLLDKPGTPVRSDIALTVAEGPRFVSRGGLKLRGALDDLGLDPTGRVCLDCGASTGGFTDCLLQAGARHVYAVDVGKNLLHEKLARDTRVSSIRKNARYLQPSDIPEPVDLAVMDLSFISSRIVLPAVVPLVRPGGAILVLVKPQFELPRSLVRKGVVRDPDRIRQAVDSVAEAALRLALTEVGRAPCRVPGPKGNREPFLLMRSGPESG